MVARPDTGPRPPSDGAPDGDPLTGLFGAWRRVVSAVAGVAGRAARALPGSRPARALAMASAYVRDPAGTLARADGDGMARLAEAGAAALAVGAGLAFLVSGALGDAEIRRFLAIGWTAAWALVRLLLLRLAGRGHPFTDTRRLEAAWGASLLPYLTAVAPPLEIAALGVSAYLAHRGLIALGASREESTRAVAVAFGGQALVEIGAWVVRGGLVFGLSLLG